MSRKGHPSFLGAACLSPKDQGDGSLQLPASIDPKRAIRELPGMRRPTHQPGKRTMPGKSPAKRGGPANGPLWTWRSELSLVARPCGITGCRLACRCPRQRGGSMTSTDGIVQDRPEMSVSGSRNAPWNPSCGCRQSMSLAAARGDNPWLQRLALQSPGRPAFRVQPHKIS